MATEKSGKSNGGFTKPEKVRQRGKTETQAYKTLELNRDS